VSTAVRAIRNTLWNGFRLAAALASALYVSIVVSRYLGPEAMGVYSYVAWVLGILTLFAVMGVPETVTRYVSVHVARGEWDRALSILETLARYETLLALLCVIATYCLLYTVRVNHRLSSLIFITSAYVALSAGQQFITATFTAFQRFGRPAAIGFINATAQVAAVSLATAADLGIEGVLVAMTVALVPATLLGMKWLRDELSRRGTHLHKVVTDNLDVLPRASAEPKGLSRPIRLFLLSTSFVVLVDMVVWQRSELFFLKRNGALAQLAFYSIAFSIVGALSTIPSAFTDVLYPMYANIAGLEERERLQLIFRKSVKYLQMFVVPMCIILIPVAGPLVRVGYGSEYAAVSPLLQIFLASLCITAVGGICTSLCLAMEDQNFIVKWGSIIAVGNIALDVVLIPKYGAVGATLANCSAQISAIVVSLVHLRTVAGMRLPGWDLVRIYVASLAASSPLYFLGSNGRVGLIVIALAATGSLLLYVLILAVSRGVSLYELDLAARLFKIRGHGPPTDDDDIEIR
jgi:O-antigen/teichoic acid export membrane protein